MAKVNLGLALDMIDISLQVNLNNLIVFEQAKQVYFSKLS